MMRIFALKSKDNTVQVGKNEANPNGRPLGPIPKD